jgi:uncharacterized protein
MIIGIISDTHDHVEEAKKAISSLIEAGAGTIMHCGDFCAPFMIDIFAEYDVLFHLVFGNIDDRHLTTIKANEHDNIILHGDSAIIEADGKKIFVNHFPDIAMMAAKSQDYDAVFYGHTHIAKVETVGKTLLLNPGDVMGRFAKPSVAFYDTEYGIGKHINLY